VVLSPGLKGCTMGDVFVTTHLRKSRLGEQGVSFLQECGPVWKDN
jgi:hypothetical protein